MNARLIALALLSGLAMGSAAAQERADAFPTRAIKIVVPFPAGGPSDVLARMIGQKMSEDWGQPVVIENRPGANTVLGAQQVAKAAPDGYTLLMAIDSTLTMNQYLYRTPPYDPFNDFAPITLTAKTMQLLIVNAASDVKTVNDLISRAKAQPGKLNYGAGTITTKLTGYLFNKSAGIETVLVPYNGSAEVAQGLLTKSVDFSFDGPSASLSLIQGGQFRVLAKFDPRPFPPVPDLPLITTAMPNMDEITVWLGLVAPKGTPAAVIDKIQAEVAKALADPDVKAKADASGLFPATSTPAEFAAFIRKEARAMVVRREGNRNEVRLTRSSRPRDIMLVASGFAARLRALFAAVWIASTLAVDQAAAQGATETYPNRAVRLVVPFPAGGPTDILSRVVAQRLSEVWGQPVVIENQPGANTAIAAARVAKMPADGYTLLAAMDVTMVLNPITNRNLSYDPLKDFVPITLGSKNTSLLSVRAEDGPRTVKELIARAKANPGKLNYGAGIITTRLAGYLFNREAGHRRAVHSVQWQPADGTGPADRRRRLHRRWRRHQPAAHPERQIAGACQAQQPSAARAARRQPLAVEAGHSGARRHFDLDRICGAGRHPAQHRRQDSTRNRQDVRRSGDRRKAGKSRHQHRQQFAGGIRCLRAQRTGPLGSSIQG